MALRSWGDTAPSRTRNRSLAMARIWSAIASPVLVSPFSREGSIRTDVGYPLSLVVNGTMITTGMCAFNASPETITTGRLPACSEPTTGLRSASQTSRCRIATGADGWQSLLCPTPQAQAFPDPLLLVYILL